MARNIISANDGLGDYVEIPLNKEYITLVSPEDVDFVNQRHWWLNDKGYVIGERCDISGKRLRLHREIVKRMGVHIEGLNVDHRNGIPNDNRRKNLRSATKAQNAQNKHGAWGEIDYRGVNKDGDSAYPYRTRIRINNERIQVGRFPTAEQAAIAYDLAALQIYEYLDESGLNFPGNPLYKNTTLDEFRNEYGYIPQSEFRGVDIEAANSRREAGYRARIKIGPNKELSYQVFMNEMDAAKCVDLMEIERSGLDAIPILNFDVSEYTGLEAGSYKGITALDFWKQYCHKYVKYKNVYPVSKKPDTSYYGRLCKNREDYRTVTFEKEEDAARATDELRIKLHGDKAIKYLNFPVENYLHLHVENVPTCPYLPDWV